MAVVTVDVTGPVASITLHNPAKLNAMSRVMWQELMLAFASIKETPGLRCVVVAGQGSHFSAGGDISEYPAFRFNETSLREFHEVQVWGALQAMLDCSLPIVASIEGNCIGAGLEIASCCDVRVATTCARFGAPIARLGFPMAPREAALVMGAVGELCAREMLLTARLLDAPTMAQRGFLNQVCSGDDLPAVVQSYVTGICQLSPATAALNKHTFRALAQIKYAQAATELIANAYHYADSAEHREGVMAFIDKRPPNF